NNPQWRSALWFFNAIGTSTTRIIAFFKELQRDDETRYWEILRQCFRNTDFFDQIITMPRLSHNQQTQMTPRGGLLNGGYNVFDISDLGQRTDDEEVEVHFYQMLQTPENLLHTLAQKFLIFGLSATADLPRCVHHFDLNWLEQQGLLLHTTDEDRNDIQLLSMQKATQRGNHGMNVIQVDNLDTTDAFQDRLY